MLDTGVRHIDITLDVCMLSCIFVHEGPDAPTESWKNRKHVTTHSKSIASTLSHFQLTKSKAGACIMWIQISEISLPRSGIPLPQSGVSYAFRHRYVDYWVLATVQHYTALLQHPRRHFYCSSSVRPTSSTFAQLENISILRTPEYTLVLVL